MFTKSEGGVGSDLGATFLYLELEVHSTIGILSVAHEALILHPRHKPVLQITWICRSYWSLLSGSIPYDSFVTLRDCWNELPSKLLKAHIMALSRVWWRVHVYIAIFWPKLKYLPFILPKLAFQHPLNIIRCRKWAKAPNRTKSF